MALKEEGVQREEDAERALDAIEDLIEELRGLGSDPDRRAKIVSDIEDRLVDYEDHTSEMDRAFDRALNEV